MKHDNIRQTNPNRVENAIGTSNSIRTGTRIQKFVWGSSLISMLARTRSNSGRLSLSALSTLTTNSQLDNGVESSYGSTPIRKYMAGMTTSPDSLTLEQFEEMLIEGDRWIELVAGRLVRLEPPNESHGDVIRNLSRPLATFLKSAPDLTACFELPLLLSHNPVTVRCPAVSCFRSGNRFEETDKVVTETRPALIIEVASTNDRRDGMSDRVKGYLDAGVSAVWVIDPVTRHVHQFHPPARGVMLKETQILSGGSILKGFEILVGDLFNRPKWDRDPARN